MFVALTINYLIRTFAGVNLYFHERTTHELILKTR